MGGKRSVTSCEDFNTYPKIGVGTQGMFWPKVPYMILLPKMDRIR